MQKTLQGIFAKAREGMVDSKAELGTLVTASPLSVKLDEDPTPLEQDEVIPLHGLTLEPGHRVALMPCTNGQYLILGRLG